MSAEKNLVDVKYFDAGDDFMFELRQMVARRCQFAGAFDETGRAMVSTPNVGHRNPANPQPTPPQTVAVAA